MTGESIWWERALDIQQKRTRFWMITFFICFGLSSVGGSWSFLAFGSLEDEWRTALDSIATYDQTLAHTQARVDSLGVLARTRDTVLVHVVDSVEVASAEEQARVERASETFVSAVDSLRARVDSVGSRLLDQIVTAEAEEDSAQAARYRGLEVRLGATEQALFATRSREAAQDSLITVHRAREALHVQAEEALQIEVRNLRASQSLTRKILVGALVVVGAQAIR